MPKSVATSSLAPPPPSITWSKRGKRADTPSSDRLIYRSKCEGFRLEHLSNKHYGETWLAFRTTTDEPRVQLLYHGKSRIQAEKACIEVLKKE